MSDKPKFTILRRDGRAFSVIFDAFADDAAGFSEFLDFAEKQKTPVAPGSTVDIADFKCVVRLRHDGTWEAYRSYATAEEAAAIEAAADAAAEVILDELLPDEDESEVA